MVARGLIFLGYEWESIGMILRRSEDILLF